MLLDLGHDLVVVVGGSVLLHAGDHLGHLFIRDEAALHTQRLARSQGEPEHVALAHQLFRAGGVQDDAGLQRGGHGKGHAGGDVGLHKARDDIRRGPLGGDDQVHPGGTAHLGHAADGFFHFLRRHQHEVSQLVDDNDDFRQRL